MRGSTVLLEGEIVIFEVLIHITQGRDQNIIGVHIFVDYGSLFHKIRGDFQVFHTAAQPMTDAGFLRQ